MPRDDLFVAPLQHFAPGIDREETPIIERAEPHDAHGTVRRPGVADRRVTLGLATEPADRTPVLVALPQDHLTPREPSRDERPVGGVRARP